MAARGVTQAELSKRLGGRVSQQAISEWIRGESEPASWETIFEIERVLDIAPGELSSKLGILPLEALGTIEGAILKSDQIDDRLREVLLALVREMLRQSDRGAQG